MYLILALVLLFLLFLLRRHAAGKISEQLSKVAEALLVTFLVFLGVWIYFYHFEILEWITDVLVSVLNFFIKGLER